MSTNRIVCRPKRAKSFTSSDCIANGTSEFEPILEYAADGSRDSLAFCSVFNRPQHKPIIEASKEIEGQAGTEADMSTREQQTTNTNIRHRQRQPDEAEIMRTKIKYHFMNPYQKYRARGRKPWKLLIQIFKIIIVTTQVSLCSCHMTYIQLDCSCLALSQRIIYSQFFLCKRKSSFLK